MKKLFIELFILVILVSGTWLGLSRVDWVGLLNINQKTVDLPQKIGDLLWKSLENSESEITSDSVIRPLKELLTRICEKNKIDRNQIKLHVLDNGDINAFALPDNHLIIYSGLLEACGNEAEFCGVLCHELGHMEKGHVMNRLVKEIGLSVLISMSSGGGHADLVKKAIKELSSTAYDRNLEKEADMAAVDYMINADIDPEGLANLLYRLQDANVPGPIYWISTHPESGERAGRIMEEIKGRPYEKKAILGTRDWTDIQKAIHK